MTRHLNKEFILEVFRDLRVLQPVLVSDCLQKCQFIFVVQLKLSLIFLEEGTGFRVELFQHHVQVKADEDGK